MRDELRQQIAERIAAEHRRRAAEQIEDSPEGHAAGFADAVIDLVDELHLTRQAVLIDAYWKLRQHAESYRATPIFQRTRDAWQGNRTDSRLYEKHVIHEFYARGVEAAARDLAELLGVPEHEIEER